MQYGDNSEKLDKLKVTRIFCLVAVHNMQSLQSGTGI